MKQIIRYVLAVVFGCIVGEIIGVVVGVVIDTIVGGEVTAGRWALTPPNVVLVICKGLVMGYTARTIAGRRGKLIGAITAFFPNLVAIILSVATNRDIVGHIAESVDTEPVLWAWVALFPAIIGGHVGQITAHVWFRRELG